MYKVTLQFDTHKITYGSSRGQWVLTKEFNDLKHCNNFIDYICRTKNYSLDELWYESGYPFKEGDDYWSIEDDNKIVWSCWDDQSEDLFNPNKILFTSFEKAEKYIESIKNVTIINLNQ